MRTVFNHLPKTGGTSIRRALAAAIGTSMDVFDPTASHPSHRSLVAHAGEQRFIASHLWFYPGERLISGWYYATILRDPLGRFLSQYYFNRQHRNQVLDGSVDDRLIMAAVNKDLSDFLADPDPYIQRNHKNWQARYFAARVRDAPDVLDEDQLLAAAIESLEDYDLVGVYGDLQGFFDVYCRDLGVAGGALPRLNVTVRQGADPALSPTLRENILANNRVDMALYEWAARRFIRDRQREGPLDTARPGRALSTAASVNFGDRQIEILSVKIGRWDSRTRISSVVPGGRVKLFLACRSCITESDLTVGFAVHDSHGRVVLGANSNVLGAKIGVCREGDFILEIGFAAPNIEGEYQVTLALHKGLTHLDGCYHWWEGAARFRVTDGVGLSRRIALRRRSVPRPSEKPSFRLRSVNRIELPWKRSRRSNSIQAA
jgi:Wzt C-terminal domain/Sulfotransferase family